MSLPPVRRNEVEIKLCAFQENHRHLKRSKYINKQHCPHFISSQFTFIQHHCFFKPMLAKRLFCGFLSQFDTEPQKMREKQVVKRQELSILNMPRQTIT